MSDRINTRVLEDAGDVIRDVNLVDVSASETLIGAAHAPDSIVNWSPALGSSIYPMYRFHVKTRQVTAGGHVNAHQLETILGKLNRVYPPSVVASARTIRSALGWPAGNTVTLALALEYALQRWATEFTWLTWATIPALTVETSSGTITPTIEALALRQPESGGKRSARQWLDDFLSLFAGYVLRVNSTGQLVIVPPPTPGHSLNLPANKILSVERSTSFDDIINRATVQSSVWAHESAEFTHPVTISAASDDPQAQAYVGSGTQPPGFPARTGFEHLGTLTEGQVPTRVDIPMQPGVISSLSNAVFFDVHVDTHHRRWEDDIPGPETIRRPNQNLGFFQEITITDGASAGETTLQVAALEHPLISGSLLLIPSDSQYSGVSSAVVNGNHARNSTTVTVHPLPFDIEGRITILHSRLQATHLSEFAGKDLVSAVGGPDELLFALAAWGTAEGGLALSWEQPINLSHRDPLNPEDEFEYGIRAAIRVYTYNWTQTNNRISATFGKADDPGQVSDLPGFVNSQSDFGVIERTLNANFINLDIDDSMAIAQAYVAANMRARERVTLEVTPDLPVKPEDINKLVTVAPLGETITVESWEHTEMYDNTSAALTTRVTGVSVDN